MATPPPNELRQMVLKFYSDNDPGKLRMGLDVNGIVEWTSRNGMEALNHMLKKQFGKTIDVNLNLGNAKQRFERMSTTLSPNTGSAQIPKKVMSTVLDENDKQDQVLYKLQEFYSKHDPSRLGDLEKLVTFTMYHGIPKLNEKLISKYGEGIPEGGVEVPTSVRMQSARGQPQSIGPRKGKEERELRADVIKYYEQVDPEQLDAIEAIMDWAMMIGRKDLDEKLEQIYGVSLNHITRPNAAQRQVKPKAKKLPNLPPKRAAGGGGGTVSPGIATDDGPNLKDFREMSSPEIREQLVMFYRKHDVDTIEKIDMIVDLALKLGRSQMNEKLKDIYNETLDDVVRQVHNRQQRRKQHESRVSVQGGKKREKKGFLGRLRKDGRGSTSQAGSSYYENQSNTVSPMAQLPQQNMGSPSPAKMKGRALLPETGGAGMGEAIARRAMERKQREASRAEGTFGAEEPCDDYEIDMMGANMGACVHCGFPKLQHKNRKQRIINIRNSRGMPAVAKMAQEMNKMARANNSTKPLSPTFNAKKRGVNFNPAPKSKPPTWARKPQQSVRKPKPRRVVRSRKDPLGPCEKFELDMAAGGVSCVKCGYNRVAHHEGKRKTFQKFFAPILGTQTSNVQDDDDDDLPPPPPKPFVPTPTEQKQTAPQQVEDDYYSDYDDDYDDYTDDGYDDAYYDSEEDEYYDDDDDEYEEYYDDDDYE